MGIQQKAKINTDIDKLLGKNELEEDEEKTILHDDNKEAKFSVTFKVNDGTDTVEIDAGSMAAAALKIFEIYKENVEIIEVKEI